MNVTIEEELFVLLNNRIKEHTMTDKRRNMEIIAYYYGFRSSTWPTLEETAEQFAGVGTRERARQIIKKFFRDQVTLADMPTIKHLVKVIECRDYWLYSNLEEEIVESNLVGDNYSIQGLFNLMKDLKAIHGYGVYTPDLKQATRNSIAEFEESFIIKTSDITRVKSLLKKSTNLPGRCGIAKLDYLRDEPDYAIYKSLITNLIKFSKDAWVKEGHDELSYLFENKDNTLINYSEKVFSVVNECKVNRLALAYRNALDARAHKYDYPPVDLIADYLRSSKYLENVNGILSFAGETTHMSEIEKDSVEYLKCKDDATFQEIRVYLNSRGHKKPSIDKAILHSPLVHVDKSMGRGSYRYSLVGSLKLLTSKYEDSNNHRYREFLKRLRQVGITDEPVEQKRRKEQWILRQ